jgi:hypothetical protein
LVAKLSYSAAFCDACFLSVSGGQIEDVRVFVIWLVYFWEKVIERTKNGNGIGKGRIYNMGNGETEDSHTAINK